MKIEISKFTSELEHQIRDSRTFDKILADLKPNQTWDKIARQRIGKIAKNLLIQCFPEECKFTKDADEAVYVEGQGTPRWWKPPYQIFGSKGVYPDIGVKLPKLQKRISIELDHSEIGRREIPGSKFKIALAKASFSCMSQDWDCCYLFFSNHSGESMKKYLDNEIEKTILRYYQEEFHTRVILFEHE